MSGKVTYVSVLADESIHPAYEKALSEVWELLGREWPIYIGGKEVYTSGKFEKRSPFDTSIKIGTFQRGTPEEFKAALSKAVEAFPEWSRLDWRERARILAKLADLIERDRFKLAAAITYEVGKNRFEALAEIHEAIDVLRYYVELIHKMDGYVLQMRSPIPNERPLSVLRPYGAWFVISPFNFPIALAKGMLTGVLLMGNTAVWKPTSEAPFTAALVYQLAVEAGVPPGVLNFVTGPGDAVEEVATGDPRVAGIAFTGSRDVGMRLYRLFTQRQPWPKPIVLEMGSKNPTVVTAKADLEKAAEGVVRAAFGFGGQKCSATSRLYVQREVYDRFVERLVEKTREIVKIGDPRRREVFLGPVINKSARENYRRYVADAVAAGGRLRYGGRVLEEGEFSKGFYVEPAIIEGVAPDSYLWKTELFLPILLVDKFDTLEEAVRKANDTEYGLTAGIFSEDPKEVEYFFEHIEFGVVYANRRGGATTGAWPGAQPFTGWKASGATGRGVNGVYYLLNFAREQARTVVY
ncbi:L-glutamate gamma-semialdehyde dehydrogenase [Thermoproteus tenax]|uniref:L-glutamate gamma-semialdehyde dehydrogenase n=2 Tax=Thermoproteus tenax TaxID=2271 RepID=G4RLG2_THETK|nr:L-glutamate gamma-semialdehyde dehydrogenase [Thermoproteus tenax]CCC82407.1 1-pyrroline-5-carboxylate dehydrogenase [Thermoproteus tenax Kra 1]